MTQATYCYRSNRYRNRKTGRYMSKAEGRVARTVQTDAEIYLQGQTFQAKKLLKELGLKWYPDSKSWGGVPDQAELKQHMHGRLVPSWTANQVDRMIAGGDLTIEYGVEPYNRPDGELSWHC